MKRIFVTLAFLALALVGCHAQLPTTPAYNTVWTWNAPTPTSNWSGCGTQGRTYVVSTMTVAAGTASCPAPTGSNYAAQQTVTTGISALTWTQANTTGESICGIVQTIWSGSTSGASAPSNVAVNPQLPLAPGAPSGNSVVSALDKPPLPGQVLKPTPEMAMNAIPMQVRAVAVRVR